MTMEKKKYTDALTNPVFEFVQWVAKDTGMRAFVIGGFVRDYFLGIPNDDIDIVVEGSGIKFAQKFAEVVNGELTVYENFGTAMVHFGDQKVEFVGARKEHYERGSRKPYCENGTLEDDQKRRDFTINAMAFDLNEGHFGELVDPFDGIGDLEKGIIRTPIDPVQTFLDDPLRMLRAIRFRCKLTRPDKMFHIATPTFEAICRNKEEIKTLSGERITEELNKILQSPNASFGIKMLDFSGLLEYILPEVSALHMPEDKGHKDIFEHTLRVLDNVAGMSDSLTLRWAALLHDIGKAVTKRYDEKRGWTFDSHASEGAKMIDGIFRRLHLPMDMAEHVKKLVDMHMRPTTLAEEGVTDSAIRRLLFDAGDDIDDLLILAKCDVTTKYESKRNKIYENLVVIEKHIAEVEEKDAIRNFKNPITGDYIMQTFGLKPGKTIAVLKDAVKEAILDGVIANDFGEAEKFVKEKAKELGLA
jgi:poly(A) polymerase